MHKEDNTVVLKYEIYKNDFKRAGEASSNIKKALKQLGIDSDIIRRLVTATYEAEINVVIHSHGGLMTVIISEKYIEVITKDRGPGIQDVDLAMKEGYSTASDAIRELGFGAGMGLPNMKKNSDVFKISSQIGKGTNIYMKMNLDNGRKK